MKYKKKMVILLVMASLVGCQPTKTIENNNINGTNESPVTETRTIAEETNELESSEAIEPVELFNHLDESSVDVKRALALISELASEKYEGRQAGTEANEMAEDYLADLFSEIGLRSPEGLDYKQLYTQKSAYPLKATEVTVIGSDIKLTYQIDFTERFTMGQTYYDADFESEMVFVMNTKQLKEDVELLNNKVLLITQMVYYAGGTWDLLDGLMADGIKIHAIILSTDAPEAGMRVARYVRESEGVEFEETDPVLLNVDTSVFTDLMKLSKEGRKLKVSMDYEVIDAEVANIVGYIPGKNEVGDDETLIIGAHFDHVGNNMNGTYNAGALDNASGIGVMLELARALMAGEQPEDTVIFIAFNGEEDGLLGSEYFVNNPAHDYNPEFTQMLNLDMVGSSGEVALQISSINPRSNDMLFKLMALSDTMGIENKKSSFGGSDHVNFASKGMAAVMLIHFDGAYYHTYMDTVENAISESRLESVIKLALAFVDSEVYE